MCLYLTNCGFTAVSLYTIRIKKLWNKIFGKKKNEYKNVSQKNQPLYLWEDDYLMIELVSTKNKEFLDKETERISDFGEENFDGVGFTDITVISDKPYELIVEKIQTSKLISIIENSGLKKVTQINAQDKGLLNQDELPLAFGNNNYAIIIEDSKGLIKNAYFVGRINNEKESIKLTNAINEINQLKKLYAVDWFKSKSYNLSEQSEIESFLKESL